MKRQPLIASGKIRLKDFDPSYSAGLDKDETKKKTQECTQRIAELQDLLYANSRHAVLLIFQGMDASGKDGAVRSVLEHVNPIGVEAANFKVPSDDERAHDFLWRVHKVVPRYGNIGVFNRSHYEAVLAERVLNIVPRAVWSARYGQIVDFERMLVANHVVLLKFYLHISKEEQAERFQERLSDPRKKWKFSHGDLKTRQLWDDYAEAYEDMINATSHKAAPWHIVPADRNWVRDFAVAQTVLKAMERLKMKWPKPEEDLSKVKIES
ncbi:MAG: polyphosphate kinase 2 family protein [Acidobacteriales bacterium]|nr:polyphosphate kinase 2 family protein [Terriglobales bacterium]